MPRATGIVPMTSGRPSLALKLIPVFLAIAAACAPSGQGLPSPTPRPEPAIIFERTGSLLARRDLLEVYPDGSLRVTDQRAGRSAQMQVQPSEVEDILRRLRQAGLRDGDVLGSSCADCYTYTLSFAANGKRITVALMGQPPATMQPILEQLNRWAESALQAGNP